mmetsp:Transcript_16028/g.14007  ORF Transcript_16028/g.14007 Transcript_16028/m.14007 type:complete len:168 (+) Transcript_16028:36-539(+)
MREFFLPNLPTGNLNQEDFLELRKIQLLIENIQKESNQALEPETNKPKMFQKPINPHIRLKNTSSNQQPSQDYYIDDTPLLDTGIEFEDTDQDLHELKGKHEKLVDLILKEEDDLIHQHHKFIEDTITSVKEQERIRHDVNLPGSDVEDYILNLDGLLTGMQTDISD